MWSRHPRTYDRARRSRPVSPYKAKLVPLGFRPFVRPAFRPLVAENSESPSTRHVLNGHPGHLGSLKRRPQRQRADVMADPVQDRRAANLAKAGENFLARQHVFEQ